MDRKLSLEKARSARGRGVKPNNRKLLSRRRKMGEYSTRRVAAVNFCRECRCGYEGDPGKSVAQMVVECTDPECHLYCWRTGKLTPDEGA